MTGWILFAILSVTFTSTEGFLVSEPTQNASLNEIYTELSSELQNLTQQINDLQEEYYNLTQENGELQREINNLTLNYDRLRRDLIDVKNDNIRLQNEYKAAESRYTKVADDFNKMAGLYNIMKQQYSLFDCEYNSFYEEYTSQIGNHSNNGMGVNSGTNNNTIQNCPPKEMVHLGFAVSYPDRGGYSRQGLLPFTNTFYNNQAFDENKGKFICKVPGLYYFVTNLLRQVGQHTEASCYLKVNNDHVAYMEAYSDRPQWGDPLSTGATVIHLNYGDEVYISDCTNVYQIAGYSNFMGFMINPDIITHV